MRYSKSFIPPQACDVCAWCYYESNFVSEEDYKQSRCYRCDSGFRKFTNAMWKYRRRNHYLQKIGKISIKLFPCTLALWRNTERLPF